SARVGIPAAKLGLVYSLEHCQRLTATVGLGNARRMLYRGDIVSASSAREMGFFDDLVQGDALAAAIAFGAPMASNAPLSVAASKRTLSAIAMGQAQANMAAIVDAFQKADRSRDAIEGARAFAEKRPPVFSGE
ncbi:MAG TPA: enoyl-CoA hydratase-related protein, partial [Roseiflexaceae bacterium]|nr:enoyl-CoA hydratase-related protein [Roseiflexaceae bacterium]